MANRRSYRTKPARARFRRAAGVYVAHSSCTGSTIVPGGVSKMVWASASVGLGLNQGATHFHKVFGTSDEYRSSSKVPARQTAGVA